MARQRPHSIQFSSFQERFLRFFAPPEARPSPFRRSARTVRGQRGSALVMAAIFMLVATTLITVGTKLVSDSSQQGHQRELYVGMAENVARAGIVDALGWFTRQTANNGVVFGATTDTYVPGQTVTLNSVYANFDQAFNPQSDTADAQLSDTNVASIGIVNEFPLDNAVTSLALYWGHYEVDRQNSSGTNSNAVRDVTSERDTAHVTGDGYVWRIVSTGYVYKRYDTSISASSGWWNTMYNQAPNTVVASAVYQTEFRKLSLVLPQPTPGNNEQGAIYIQQISKAVTLQNTETTLSGAVSTYGNYAAIGMTSP
jgi:hypothetical protein